MRRRTAAKCELAVNAAKRRNPVDIRRICTIAAFTSSWHFAAVRRLITHIIRGLRSGEVCQRCSPVLVVPRELLPATPRHWNQLTKSSRSTSSALNCSLVADASVL